MDRRTFIGTFARGVLAAPLIANAQQTGQIRRIGVLSGGTVSNVVPTLSASLRDYGWVEGQNLIIEARGSGGKAGLADALAAELVQLKVEVIVTFGSVGSVAAKNATTTIPIVTTTGDPVRLGLVSSMSRPGGNITGVTTIAPELAAKRLELLREFLPKATRIGELVDPGNQYWQLVRKDYEEVFRSLGMQPIFVELADPAAVDQAFAALTRQRAEALIVRGDPVFFATRDRIMDLALKHALPTMAETRPLVAAGAFVSYGPNVPAMFGRTAALVDKILKGAKPGDLAIEQPTKFEFVINLKTAKALGITIPQSLLLRADEVIQ
jgi:putative tryptophan/tyrosine transport system substrate-binding protein